MKYNVIELIVKYNGTIVGYLKQIDKFKVAFQYDKEWIKHGFSISPIFLPLSDKTYISNKFDFDGLLAVFYESLPDGWGRKMISYALAKEKIDYDKLSALSKLSLIPPNGLGGLTYYPTIGKNKEYKNIDCDKLQEKINNFLVNKIGKTNFDDMVNMGSPSGGSRPKIHIKIDGDEWIVKFRNRNDPKDIGRLEYDANILAKECGINTNEIKLFKSNKCPGYFAAKRFDIINKKRIHVISLASVLEQSVKYANLDYGHLAQVIKKISVNLKDDLIDAYKRMCLYVEIGNKDDHGKNFAFLYSEKEKGYRLSPAYDITPMPDTVEHEMTINGNGKPGYDDLIDISSLFNLAKSKAKEILNDIHKKSLKYNLVRLNATK